METLFEEEENFEKVKNIVKELIFSGADRNLKNDSGLTPLDLLEQLKPDLESDDYSKLKYILTPPQGNRYLRMTRPIEKVDRGAGC